MLLQHNNITPLHQLVWDLLLVQGTSPKYVYLQNRSNLIWFWGISGTRPNWCIFHIYAIKYILGQFSAHWGRPATTLFGLEWLKSKQLANVIMGSISTKIQPLFCITSAPQKCLCYFWLWLEPEATQKGKSPGVISWGISSKLDQIFHFEEYYASRLVFSPWLLKYFAHLPEAVPSLHIQNTAAALRTRTNTLILLSLRWPPNSCRCHFKGLLITYEDLYSLEVLNF